jgi:general secretion pathway protein D
LNTRQHWNIVARNSHGIEVPRVTTAPAMLAAWLCAIVLLAAGCDTPPQAPADGAAPATAVAAQPSAPLNGGSNGAPAVAKPPVATTAPAVPPTANDDHVQRPAQDQVIAAAAVAPKRTRRKQPSEQKPVVEPQPAVAAAPGVKLPRLPGGAGADPNELISVNFDNVEIRTVLKTIGEITGINFIPHDSVTGTVTVMSPTPIRLGDLYAFLQSILDVHGYATVEMDNAVKVVPKAEATKSHSQVRVGSDPAAMARTDAIVRQIIPLKYAEAAEISDIITPILSPGAQIATYPRTNSLLITDTSANINHIAEVIRRLDVEGSQEKVLVFPLTHASAQTMSEQILRILEKSKTPGGGGPPMARLPVPGLPALGPGPRVLPDDRTNSLIVIATEQDAQIVKGLVQQLDIERPAGMDRVHVVYLKNADANEVSRSLERALNTMKLAGAVPVTPGPQIQVTPDGSTNALVIVAPPSDFEVISQIIEKLDIVREQVLVEMLILEISDENLRQLGVDWSTLGAPSPNGTRGFAATNLGPRVDFLSGAAQGLSLGAWKFAGGTTQIAAILNAMQAQSGVNILSTPHILASNHRKAKIVVGENRAFVNQSRITETTDPAQPTVIKSFEYKDVGITLDITPHVSQGGTIRLDLKAEFTKLIDDVTNAASDTPTTAKRTASTVVTMSSGATVVIGGLIRDDTVKTTKKVPLLGDIPGLGLLFQSQSSHIQKTNLLLFITPQIMSSPQELQEMTDHKKQQMDEAREAQH